MKISKRIENIPPYIFDDIDKIKEETEKKGIDIIDLGIGDPDIPTPPSIVDKMAEAIRKPENHGYPPYRGTDAFRQAVCDWYQDRFNVSLNPKTETLALIGSKEGISHTFFAFLDPGDVALVTDPGYPAYEVGVLIANGVPYHIHVYEKDHYEPNLENIPETVLKKAKLLFLNFPNNPTGAMASDTFYEKAITWAKKHDILICSDLAYSEVYYDEKPKSIFEFKGAKDVAIEFHTLSKTFNMTGWRVGMALGNEKAIHALGNIKTNMDSGVFKAIQETAIYAFENYQPIVDAQNNIYRERRNIIVDALNRLGWSLDYPKATYYIWAPVPKGFSSKEFCLTLLNKLGVLVVPGTGYGKNGEGYFRISITTPTDRLKEAMKRLKKLKDSFSHKSTPPKAAKTPA